LAWEVADPSHSRSGVDKLLEVVQNHPIEAVILLVAASGVEDIRASDPAVILSPTRHRVQGRSWSFPRTEIKNVQDCLFTHAARDAAVSLAVVQYRQVVIALEAQRFQCFL